MFVKNFSHISRAHISKCKRCFNVKSSTYYFHMKAKIFTDFQICISVPLKKTKLNCLTDGVCFRVRSITKKAKHVNYSVKVQSETYTVKSTVHVT